jgi:formate dehydrogenase subunit gamma
MKPDTQTTLDQVQLAIDANRHLPGALLPILHQVQDMLGYIPGDSVQPIAAALNLSRAEVHGVITYYHHFRQTPPGRHVVQVCRAEACQARGAAALEKHIQSSLGCGYHETTPDGMVSLEPVYCLGQCATGPAVMVDDVLRARMRADTFDALLRARIANAAGGAS